MAGSQPLVLSVVWGMGSAALNQCPGCRHVQMEAHVVNDTVSRRQQVEPPP
jgi:hypothetical protein